jgi:diadenylate cyclase
VSEETGTISFAVNGKLRKIPRKELRASLVNELNWFNSKEKDGEKDDQKG